MIDYMCRLLAELASKVIYYLGSYNLITASCQTFSDEFLKQLGSCGYNTYVKTVMAAATVAGFIAAGVAAYYWFTGGKENKK